MVLVQSVANKPLQKNRAQQDEVIKRALVKPQMVENNVENLIEMLDSCLDFLSFQRRLDV